MKAAKFDIVVGVDYPERGQFVVTQFFPKWHAKRGGMYEMVSLENASTAVKFADEFEVVTRHANNLHLDIGTSELARKTTHAVRMVNSKS